MKYLRLSRPQFEELADEFAKFLAVQSIDKKQWDEIKANNSAEVERQLDNFSDFIWDGVLSNTAFLEHFTKSIVFLFKCSEENIQAIVVKCADPNLDLTTAEGVNAISDSLFTDLFEIQSGAKNYTPDRNTAIFEIIKQGAFISDGEMFSQIDAVIRG